MDPRIRRVRVRVGKTRVDVLLLTPSIDKLNEWEDLVCMFPVPVLAELRYGKQPGCFIVPDGHRGSNAPKSEKNVVIPIIFDICYRVSLPAAEPAICCTATIRRTQRRP
jgi:hypothetical protein